VFGWPRRLRGQMDFDGGEWSRAFWDHFTHLKVVGEVDGKEVRVLFPRACIACWRLWEAERERAGPHEVGQARAAFRVSLSE